MSKFLNEENTIFSEKPLSKKLENANITNDTEKIKIFDSANAKILDKSEQKKRNFYFKLIDKSILILNIITNIAFLFFISDVINGIIFTNVLYYEFTTNRVIGVIIFAIAQLTGLYLFIKMFKNANVKTRLILATAPLTIVLLTGVWLILSSQNLKGKVELAIVTVLGLDDFNTANFEFKYILIVVAIYLIGLYFLYGAIFKNSNLKLNKEKMKK